MTCRSRFTTHDGLDVRLVAVWPTRARYALCAGCRRAAAAMGMDAAETGATALETATAEPLRLWEALRYQF